MSGSSKDWWRRKQQDWNPGVEQFSALQCSVLLSSAVYSAVYRTVYSAGYSTVYSAVLMHSVMQ